MADQASAPTNAVSASSAVEADLDRLSRRIDPVLRRHFGTRQMSRLLRTSAESWPLSGTTLLLTFALMALAAVLLRDAPIARTGAMVVIAILAVAFDARVLPRIALARHRFRLMRRTGDGGDGDHPHPYVAARVHGDGTGFGVQHWKAARGIEPGDLVVSISDASDRGVAIVVLRTEGRLPLIAWDRDFYQEDALPPLAEGIKTLAREFGAACDTWRAHASRMARSRALRTGPAARKPREPGDPGAAWAAISLPAATRARLMAMASHFEAGSASAARGLLLYGPPGTGKTLVARALADSLDCACFALSLPDLKAAYVGQSGARVRDLWTRARAEPRAIVFIDECEGVFARRGGTGSDGFGEDIVNAFIAQWDGFDRQTSVWVIGASNRRDLIDAAVLSRFDDQVQIGLPDAAQRVEILQREFARVGRTAPLPAGAATLTQGLSGRDLHALAKRIAREAAPDAVLSDAMLDTAARATRRQGSTETDTAARWDSLVLAERTLKELATIAGLLKNADAFLARGIGVPRGLLLYGPPGTGKTQIARTLANETGLRFIAASTADLKQGFVGHSGQKVRELFERAREAAPALLFLDEIDIVAGTRGGGGGGDAFTAEILGQLLQEMDGARAQPQHVFVLAASNRVDQLDPAVLSRLPTRIEIPLPDAEAIRRLLRVMLSGKPTAFDLDAGIASLAARIGGGAGVSGRDLRNWIERAERNAVQRAVEAGDPDSVALRLEDFDG